MTDHPIISPKKLIEVALPLDAINAASAREKSIRHGHPSTLHLWWARRPLATARAVIFSQLVNDPEDLWRVQNPGVAPNKQVRGHWTKARARLFKIIEDLVLWENTTNEEVLEKAREEIRKGWREVCDLNKEHPRAGELFNRNIMPGLHDPFAGGGTIPLEAQRLGLDAYASDLNPVAVLINKAMIEIPPKFAGMPAVNPESSAGRQLVDREWKGTEGLAEDVRYYAKWMRDEAEERIGHLYPKVKITDEMLEERRDLEPYRGKTLTVLAWIWARTVKSPSPAFSSVDVPLVSSFVLAKKRGKEAAVEPIVESNDYRFSVRLGTYAQSDQAKSGTKFGRGNFRCLFSNAPIPYNYVDTQANEGKMSQRLMAVVVKGDRERVYLSPTKDIEQVATKIPACWKPNMPSRGTWGSNAQGRKYGFKTFGDYFTARQSHLLATLSDIAAECTAMIQRDSNVALKSKSVEYGDAISTYLAIIVDKLTESHSSLCTWSSAAKNELVVSTFRRQGIAMTWDYAEANPFADSSGSIEKVSLAVARVISMALTGISPGFAIQADAATQAITAGKFVSTDPPYYDNIGYADLSDYFYGWLRRSMRDFYPDLFTTLGVPKADELIASKYRQGSEGEAETFFMKGMTRAISVLSQQSAHAYPITIYYAFKQNEMQEQGATSSTGWETFLEAVVGAGLVLSGTWPLRTEREGRSTGINTNALASSIVLVCNVRNNNAISVSRRDFVRELNATLPVALDAMTRESEGLPSPVAPVDLSQAIIGPGMAVFSKYNAVLEADGSKMSVKTALQLINRFLAEDDFDSDTQFCLHWIEQHGWNSESFGSADVLARAKATSVSGLTDAGVIESGGGKVRLLKWTDYPSDWYPKSDFRTPVWEALHHLIRALKQDGESAAGKVLGSVASKAEAARQLAYRLYTLCERKGWAEDARAYNELITSWSAIESAAPKIEQRELF